MSNVDECVLSPSRDAPHSASTAAMASDGTCTMRASVPAARASVRAIWSHVRTSSVVMWKASPRVSGLPRSGTNPRAKSAWCVSVHSEDAVTVHDDLLALAHPFDDGPSTVERNRRAVVGVRGTHDRHRQVPLAVRRHQQVLTGDLVPAVLPVRVAQGGRLADRETRRRSLVRGRGTDEHVLPRPSFEQVEVGTHVVGCEGHPVDDDVELPIAEHIADRARRRGCRLPAVRPRAAPPADRCRG